jgi:PKD repeat protein
MFNMPYWYCEKLWTHLISLGIALIIGCVLATQSLASNVSITWDPSPGTDVAGYVIEYGVQSGNYGYEIDVGNVTEFTLTSLNDGITYYIAVRAYNGVNQFSVYSNEVMFNGSSDFGSDVFSISPFEMSLVRVDSEEIYGEDGRGENAIDGDPSSIWHTEYYNAKSAHPHEIVIDLGYDRQVCGFSYLPRQDGSYNGGIALYEFYASTDDQKWGNPVAAGVFPRTSYKQEVAFDARHARYVRLVALSEVAGNIWTSAAEIEVMEQMGVYVNETPQAVIEADLTSGHAPLTVTFDAGASSDSDGYVVEHRWDFGDGGSGTGVMISHDLMTPGTYPVTLTVVDNEGATAQAQLAITVNDTMVEFTGIPYWEMSLVRVDSEEIYGEDGRGENAIDGDPSSIWHTRWYHANIAHPHEIVIDLGYDRQVCGFSYLPRQDGSYNGGIALYEFYASTDDQNWGNPVAAGVFPCSTDKQEVAFDARHARYVRLVALSEVTGNIWTSAAEIEVMEQTGGCVNETPEAVIEADLTSGLAPLTVTFDAGGSSDSDGYVVEYRWNFGDGGSGTGVTISHNFMTSGTYPVTLTVVDNQGATSQAQLAITVNDTPVKVRPPRHR